MFTFLFIPAEETPERTTRQHAFTDRKEEHKNETTSGVAIWK